MAKSVVKTLRLNPKTEQELYSFVESKGGLKKALTHLFNEYKVNKRVEDIVDRLKDEVQFTAPKGITQTITTTTTKPKDNSKAAGLLTANFIK